MSVVTVSQMNLMRTRRQMREAFLAQDWDTVQQWDQLLAVQLNKAFDDPERDNTLLIKELEHILGLYADMVESLPDEVSAAWTPSLTAPFAD